MCVTNLPAIIPLHTYKHLCAYMLVFIFLQNV